MATSPIIRLANALKAASNGGDFGRLLDIAHIAGVSGGLARRAAKSIPINVSAYLRLCGGLGIDPVDGTPCAAVQVGDLSWNFVALALKGERALRGHSIAKAKKEIGNIGDATISRVENGMECTVEHFLAICKYLRRHPYKLVAPTFPVKPAVKDIDSKRETASA